MRVSPRSDATVFLLSDTRLSGRIRAQTFYAQEIVRLDRGQRVIDIGEVVPGRVFAVVSRLLFNIPAARLKELQSFFIDDLVYVHPWADFIHRSQNEWKQHFTWVRLFNICATGYIG